jgi:hypothetical protein
LKAGDLKAGDLEVSGDRAQGSMVAEDPGDR